MRKIQLPLNFISFLFIVCSLCIFVSTNPKYGIGLWPQSEPVIVSFFALGVIGGMLLLAHYILRPKQTTVVLRHPIVVCPILIGLFSLIAALSVEFPWRSILGAPELGEGVLWYLSLALLTANALIIKRLKFYRNIIVLFALAVALVVSLMTIKGDALSLWRPYFFTDFLAFFSIFIVPVVFINFEIKNYWQKLVVFLICMVPIICSQNHSAEPLILLGPLMFVFYELLQKKLPIRTILIMGCASGGVIIVGLISFLGYYYPPGEGLANITQSVWSRYNLILSAWQSLNDATATEIWFGHGWGAFTDIAAIYIPLAQTKLFMLNTASDKIYWDALSRSDFHSHAQLVEAIISVGIIGAFLITVYSIIPLLTCKRKNLFITFFMVFSIIVVSNTWFQFTITLPFMPIALALCCATTLNHKWRGYKNIFQRNIINYSYNSTILFSMIILSVGTYMAFDVSNNSTSFAPPRLSESEKNKCGDEIKDMPYGGLRLGLAYHQINNYLANAAPEDIMPDWWDRFAWVNCAVERYIENGAGARLKIIDLLAISEWAFVNKDSQKHPIVEQMLASWGGKLENFLLTAPNRTDLLAPYLSWRQSENDDDTVYRLAKKYYLLNQQDPVGLWFLGATELKDPSAAKHGIKKMRLALSNGIQDILPIEDELIAMVENTKLS